MSLFQSSIHDARDRHEHVVNIVVVPPRQGLDVLPAQLVGFARGLILDRRQRCHDFQGDLFPHRKRERNGRRRKPADLYHDIFAAVGVLNGADRIGTGLRNDDVKLPGLVADPLGNHVPFLVAHLHGRLVDASKVLMLYRTRDRPRRIPVRRIGKRREGVRKFNATRYQ